MKIKRVVSRNTDIYESEPKVKSWPYKKFRASIISYNKIDEIPNPKPTVEMNLDDCAFTINELEDFIEFLKEIKEKIAND